MKITPLCLRKPRAINVRVLRAPVPLRQRTPELGSRPHRHVCRKEVLSLASEGAAARHRDIFPKWASMSQCVVVRLHMIIQEPSPKQLLLRQLLLRGAHTHVSWVDRPVSKHSSIPSPEARFIGHLIIAGDDERI